MKQKRGEIVTLLTIAVLILIGASTAATSFILQNKKQTTKSKAAMIEDSSNPFGNLNISPIQKNEIKPTVKQQPSSQTIQEKIPIIQTQTNKTSPSSNQSSTTNKESTANTSQETSKGFFENLSSGMKKTLSKNTNEVNKSQPTSNTQEQKDQSLISPSPSCLPLNNYCTMSPSSCCGGLKCNGVVCVRDESTSVPGQNDPNQNQIPVPQPTSSSLVQRLFSVFKTQQSNETKTVNNQTPQTNQTIVNTNPQETAKVSGGFFDHLFSGLKKTLSKNTNEVNQSQPVGNNTVQEPGQPAVLTTPSCLPLNNYCTMSPSSCCGGLKCNGVVCVSDPTQETAKTSGNFFESLFTGMKKTLTKNTNQVNQTQPSVGNTTQQTVNQTQTSSFIQKFFQAILPKSTNQQTNELTRSSNTNLNTYLTLDLKCSNRKDNTNLTVSYDVRGSGDPNKEVIIYVTSNGVKNFLTQVNPFGGHAGGDGPNGLYQAELWSKATTVNSNRTLLNSTTQQLSCY